MWWEDFKNSDYYQPVISSGVFLISVLIAAVIFVVMRFVANRLRTRTPGGIGALVLRSVRTPVVAFTVFLGGLIAVRAVPELDAWQDEITRGWNVLVIVLVARAVSASSRVIITWYIDTEIAQEGGESFNGKGDLSIEFGGASRAFPRRSDACKSSWSRGSCAWQTSAPRTGPASPGIRW